MTDGPDIRTCKAAIAVALNDRFVPPARAMLESIRRHSGGLQDVTLVALTKGLSASSVEALEHSAARAGLSFSVRLIGDVEELGSIPDWAVFTCLRLYVGEMCQDFERALYLDSDMLVLDSLAPLILTELGERTAAAVINHPPFDVMRVAIRRSQRGDADGDAPYFNAGVLLIDVERWKSRSVGLRSRAFLKRFPATRLLDQDALNMALVNDWRQLDREWNAPAGPLADSPLFRGLAQMNRSILQSMREWEAAQTRPRILHFTGQPKPWEEGYPWPELSEQYRAYILPEFAEGWPSSNPQAFVDERGEQKVREFRRV